MTPAEYRISIALERVRCLPGGWDKRFIKSIVYKRATAPKTGLTKKQHQWLLRLLYKFRAQVPYTYALFAQTKHCRRAPKSTPKPTPRPRTNNKKSQLKINL